MHDGIISMRAVESNRICLEAWGLHLTSRRKGYEISGDACGIAVVALFR